MPKFLKCERILKKSDFAAAYRSSDKLFTKNLFMAFVKSGKKRIGFTISAKVGKANIRNRIKRTLREYFRLNKEAFPECDVVITARQGAAKLTNDEIRAEVARLLGKKKDV